MLLLWGRFALSQTIIPEAKEHFPTPSASPDTHPFGGLGLRWLVPLGDALEPQDIGNGAEQFTEIEVETMRDKIITFHDSVETEVTS